MIHNAQFELDLPPLNVLVAEDGLANRVLARGLLTRDGHKVTLAEDGRQAVARWLDTRYDLVLMDVDMPIMDGLSATRTIRSQEAARQHGVMRHTVVGHETVRRRTPVVALTSNMNRDECLAAGMDAFLSKPLDLDAFRRVVSTLLQ